MSLLHVVGKTFLQAAGIFREKKLSTWAAALTYYAILSTFPALIVLVSFVGLVGDQQQVTASLLDVLQTLGPSSITDTFSGSITELTRSRGAAGIFLLFGVVVALFSASGYVSAFSQVSHVIYGTEDRRSFLRLKPLQIFTTFALILLLAAAFFTVLFTDEMIRATAGMLSLGESAASVFMTARFLISFALLLVVVLSLYITTMEGEKRKNRIKELLPGALFAVIGWLIISLLFRFYITHFSSYNKTYGAMAGFVILLIWFWLSNLAILFGAAMNAVSLSKHSSA